MSHPPLIFDIRHFALDDGPGIRTTVFLKGCPLSCIWCQNPESQRAGPEMAFYPSLCIGCGECDTACQEKAIDLEYPKRVMRDRCTACGLCAEACPTTALKRIGQHYSVDILMENLLADHFFYETSGGGVTFSGGEPTLHMDYLSETAKELRRRDIHVALQTSGMFDLDKFKATLMPYLDLLYYDIKLFDPGEHEKYTDVRNLQILSNFTNLFHEPGIEIVPRIPLVPGITATAQNLKRIADFLRRLGCSRCELLPYNPAGLSKHLAMGRDVPMGLQGKMMDIDEERQLKKYVVEMINCPYPKNRERKRATF